MVRNDNQNQPNYNQNTVQIPVSARIRKALSTFTYLGGVVFINEVDHEKIIPLLYYAIYNFTIN